MRKAHFHWITAATAAVALLGAAVGAALTTHDMLRPVDAASAALPLTLEGEQT